jgi:hypothetical protein
LKTYVKRKLKKASVREDDRLVVLAYLDVSTRDSRYDTRRTTTVLKDQAAAAHILECVDGVDPLVLFKAANIGRGPGVSLYEESGTWIGLPNDRMLLGPVAMAWKSTAPGTEERVEMERFRHTQPLLRSS